MQYILKIILFIIAGVVAANLLLEFGGLNFLNRLLMPLLKFSNLSVEAGVSTIFRTFSPSAGYSVLGEYFREGRIGRTEVMMVMLLASFPFNLTKLFRFYIPVLLPIFGTSLGIAFIAVKMTSALMQSLFAVFYGRMFFEPKDYHSEDIPQSRNLKKALRKSYITLKRVIPAFLIAIILVNLLIGYTGIEKVSRFAYPLTNKVGLPAESSIVIISQIVNMPAGYVVAAEFLRQGLLTGGEVLLTVVIGLIIAVPRIFIQYSLPVATSLFGFNMGASIVATKMAAEMISLSIILAFILWS